MELDLAAKVSVRRHLGLPAAGTPLQGSTLGLRTVIRAAGQVELYMNSLQLEEYATIVGSAYGSFRVYDPVNVGARVQVIVKPTGATTPTTVSYTAVSGDNSQTMTAQLAQSVNSTFPNFRALPIATQQLGYGELAIVANSTFTLATIASGGVNVVLNASGDNMPSPQFVVDDGNGDPTKAIIAYGLLPICDALEKQMLGGSANLAFSSVGSTSTGAAVFRPDEIRMRDMLLRRYRHELGVMVGFYDPSSLYTGGSDSGGTRVLV